MDLFCPILDRFICELNTRFSGESISITKAIQALVIVKSDNFLNYNDIQPLVDRYSKSLKLNESLLQAEILIAKELMSAIPPSEINFSRVLQCVADDSSFPNLRMCMRLALTLPISSATCERSFSAMKYIKNFLRNRMSDERLSSLAILNINKRRTVLIDPTTVVDSFANSGCRTLAFT